MGHSRNRLAAIGMVLAAGCSTPGINANAGSGGEGASNHGGGGGGSSEVHFIIPDAAGPGGPGAGDAGGDAKTCGMQMFNLEKLPPEVLLVLDRSGSMQEKPTAGALKTKWDEVKSALDPSVMETQSVVSWGLKVFPTDSEKDICAVTDAIEVPIAAGNYAAMSAAIDLATPIPMVGGTPTNLTIEGGVTYLKTLTTPNPKYMLLATDGQPTCRPGGGLGQEDAAGSVAAIKAAAALGFHTFVVGIATAGTGANAVLNDMAKAGGEPRNATPQYYPVTSKADLSKALSLITKRISSCTFPLTEKPPSPNDVAMNIGGIRVPRDTTEKNGWNYNEGMKSIDVFGSWCDMLKNSTADMLKVDIIFGCPFIPIP